MKSLSVTLVLVVTTIARVHAQGTLCPDPLDILPCLCSEPLPGLSTLPSLYCGKAQSNDVLEDVFQAPFPQPEFDVFEIDSNVNITELNAAAPAEVNFHNIILRDFPLEEITAEFFEQFAETLTQIIVDRTDITNDTFPFAAIEQLPNLEVLNLEGNEELASVPPMTSTSLINLEIEYTEAITSLQVGKTTTISIR